MTVQALRSPSYREAVLWQEQATFPDVPASPPPPSADYVVVGAGYAGLSCARELARAGRSVAVLDAHGVGWGASSRNGGMVIPELKAGPAALGREYGHLGRRMYDEVNEAFDHVEGLIADESIECDYRRTGQLYLAHAERVVPALRAMAREHGDELGEPVTFVPRDALGDEVGSTAYAAGVVMERTGGLHPARFHAGLLRLASPPGHPCTPRRRRPPSTVDRATPPASALRPPRCGRRRRRRGLHERLRRWPAARAAPPGAARGQLHHRHGGARPDLARSVSPRDRMLVDSKNFLFYWRLTPDRRLVFGGRRSLAPSTIPEARDFLYRSMLRIHPQLAGTRIDRALGGNVAITLDRLPHVGRLDGAWYLAGCNGSGVALNTWLGARMARHLLGDAALPSFAKLRHRPIPLHGARAAYLPFVGLWFRWQDRGFAG